MSEETNPLRDFIDALEGDDNVEASEIFDQEIAQRVSDAFADRKVELASTLFGEPEEYTGDEEVEDIEIDLEDSYEEDLNETEYEEEEDE